MATIVRQEGESQWFALNSLQTMDGEMTSRTTKLRPMAVPSQNLPQVTPPKRKKISDSKDDSKLAGNLTSAKKKTTPPVTSARVNNCPTAKNPSPRAKANAATPKSQKTPKSAENISSPGAIKPVTPHRKRHRKILRMDSPEPPPDPLPVSAVTVNHNRSGRPTINQIRSSPFTKATGRTAKFRDYTLLEASDGTMLPLEIVHQSHEDFDDLIEIQMETGLCDRECQTDHGLLSAKEEEILRLRAENRKLKEELKALRATNKLT